MSVNSFSIFSGEFNLFVTPQKKYKNDLKVKEELLNSIKDIICYHQGKFIQYAFLASEFHKEMKKALYETPQDLETLADKYDNLLNYLNEQFAKVSNHAFKDAQNYFKNRHPIAPRVCLKGNYHTIGSYGQQKQKVVKLFKENDVGYNSDCFLEKNSGFKYVRDTGKFYSCQNIPEDLNYENPRINNGAKQLYRSPSKRFWQFPKKEYEFDLEWEKCWENKSADGTIVNAEHHDHYKSTLVIPLTLINNELDEKFLSKFDISKSIGDIKRTIFGYLCFDHVATNYFEVEKDKSMGYILADILSLYLLIRAIFVTQSQTCRDVDEKVRCGLPGRPI